MKHPFILTFLLLTNILSVSSQDWSLSKNEITFSTTYKKAKKIRSVEKALRDPEAVLYLSILVTNSQEEYLLFHENHTKFKNLRKLVIDDRWSSNKIGSLPDLSTFLELEYLQVFASIDMPLNGLDQLTNLKYLALLGMGFNEIPPEIFSLKQLEYLDLSASNLTSLPERMRELKNLKELDLTNNCFSAVPTEIIHLQSLMYFDMNNAETGGEEEPNGFCNNKLLEYPEVFRELSSLKFVSFYRTIVSDELKQKVLDDLGHIKIRF